MKSVYAAGVLLAVLTFVSPRAATLSTTSLAVQGRSNATVSLRSHGPFVAAAWSASLPSGATDIYVATSRDGGTTFTAPVLVNSVPGDARVNGEQPPRVTLAPSAGGAPLMTVVWTSRNAQDATILQARSDDGGRTFSRAMLVPDGAAAGNRGWEDAAADAQGRTHVVWLDHREMATPETSAHVHSGHDTGAPKDGVSMAQKSKLYFATVGESGSAKAVAAGVCYCCKTAVVAGPGKTLYLAWRHVYPGNLRDIAFTFSQDGGRTFAPPRRVSEDHWQLDGCPDDGPAMSLDGDNRLHIAWPTLVSDGPGGKPSIGIFYAQSRDRRAFSTRERLVTDGLPHHPQVMTNAGKVFVLWDELQDGRRRIVMATRPAQAQSGPFMRVVLAEGAGLLYPSVAPSGSGALVAWTAGGERSTIQLARVQ